MSRERLETIRRAEAAFNTAGAWKVTDFVVEDVEWGTTGAFPGIDRVYRGPAGMDKWRSDMRSAWQSFEVEVADVLAEGRDHLVLEERVRGRGHESGVEVEMSIFSAYYFRGDKLAKRMAFKDRQEALAALERSSR